MQDSLVRTLQLRDLVDNDEHPHPTPTLARELGMALQESAPWVAPLATPRFEIQRWVAVLIVALSPLPSIAHRAFRVSLSSLRQLYPLAVVIGELQVLVHTTTLTPARVLLCLDWVIPYDRSLSPGAGGCFRPWPSRKSNNFFTPDMGLPPRFGIRHI